MEVQTGTTDESGQAMSTPLGDPYLSAQPEGGNERMVMMVEASWM